MRTTEKNVDENLTSQESESRNRQFETGQRRLPRSYVNQAM